VQTITGHTTTNRRTDVSSTIKTEISEINPYFEEIKRHIMRYDASPEQLSDQCYALYDFDKNGAKELIIGLKDWGIVDVYTIQNGVAVRQAEFFVDPYGGAQPTLLKNGTIRKEWMYDGCQRNISYHRFEDGELKFQISLRDDCDNWGSCFQYDPVTKNETQINKKEFDRLKKEFEGDGQVIELDWKPLTEYGQ